MGLAFASVPTLGRDLGYWANERNPATQPPPADIIEFRRRGIISVSEYYLLMKRAGFNSERAGGFYDASKQLLGFGDALTLFRRGEITQARFYQATHKLGFNAGITDELVRASEYFPNPQDLVRFAVREVYTPEVVDKFQLDADLPDKFVTESLKAGVPREQALNFWRSHWVLPSVGLGYEMLHRGIINEEDLSLLLKTQDVMPYWRDKVIDLSYRPYTRVDVRRMYEMGILDKEQVYRSYLDLGYNPEKADNMTKFTIAYAEPTERNLTRAMIIQGLEQGEITREECIAYLSEIGYDPENAEYIVSLEENKWLEATLKEQISALTTMFKGGLMNQEAYISELDRLNLKATYRNKLVASALTTKQGNLKLPTKTDVRDWFVSGLIDEPAFKDYYQRLGFSDKEIGIYIEEIFLQTLDSTEEKTREGTPRLLPRTTLTRFYIEDTIEAERLIQGLLDLNFRTEDIETLFIDAEKKRLVLQSRLDEIEGKAIERVPTLIPRSRLRTLFLEATIDEARLREGLGELDYRRPDIELLVASAKKKLSIQQTKEDGN